MNLLIPGTKFNYRQCESEDRLFVYQTMRANLEEYFRRFSPEGWSDNKFFSGFNKERIKIIQTEDLRVGFWDLEINQIAICHNLHLIREYRGKGLRILKFLEDYAKLMGAEEISGKCFTTNQIQDILLKRLGYHIKREIPSEFSIEVAKRL